MEICDMGGIRSPAGHHWGSAWAAQGLLDERLPTMTMTLMMKSGWWWCFDDYYLMKDSTLFCKLVKVWSFHGWACYDARINLVTDSWPYLLWLFLKSRFRVCITGKLLMLNFNSNVGTLTSWKKPKLGLKSSEPMKRTFFLAPVTSDSGRVEEERIRRKRSIWNIFQSQNITMEDKQKEGINKRPSSIDLIYVKLFMFELQMQTGSSVLSRFLKHHLGDQRVHPDKKRSIEMLATAKDNIFVLFDWFIFCWLRGPAWTCQNERWRGWIKTRKKLSSSETDQL